MDIIYSLKDALFKASNIEELKAKIQEFFTLHGISPQVNIDGELVHVHIDTNTLQSAEEKFNKASKLLTLNL